MSATADSCLVVRHTEVYSPFLPSYEVEPLLKVRRKQPCSIDQQFSFTCPCLSRLLHLT